MPVGSLIAIEAGSDNAIECARSPQPVRSGWGTVNTGAVRVENLRPGCPRRVTSIVKIRTESIMELGGAITARRIRQRKLPDGRLGGGSRFFARPSAITVVKSQW